MTRMPSKYSKLSFLRGLRDSYYISTSGIEYCAESVENLINEKESTISENATPKDFDFVEASQEIPKFNFFRAINHALVNESALNLKVGLKVKYSHITI